jgi:hypothetical protein
VILMRDVSGVAHSEWRNPFRNMTSAAPGVTLPDCGVDPGYNKRVMALSKQSTEARLRCVRLESFEMV